MFTTTVRALTIRGEDAKSLYRTAVSNLVLGEEIEPALSEVRVWAVSEIQRLRGEARGVHVPDVPGQELVYANKLRQAEVLLSAKKSDQFDYPALCGAEAKVRGLSATKMGELIIAKARAWQTHSDSIDAATLKARLTLEKAKSLDEIVATLAALATEIGG